MPRYVDGFVIPIPKKNLAEYRRVAAMAGKTWRRHGALHYFECVGDDLAPAFGSKGFPHHVKLKRGETVLFSWIGFKSRAHRDRVNAKVMKDPRFLKLMGAQKKMPFDIKRMNYGGFRVIVDA